MDLAEDRRLGRRNSVAAIVDKILGSGELAGARFVQRVNTSGGVGPTRRVSDGRDRAACRLYGRLHLLRVNTDRTSKAATCLRRPPGIKSEGQIRRPAACCIAPKRSLSCGRALFPIAMSSTLSDTTSQPRSLLSMARLNRQSPGSNLRLGALSEWTCFGPSGGFAPTIFPLFQGTRLETTPKILETSAMVTFSVNEVGHFLRPRKLIKSGRLSVD